MDDEPRILVCRRGAHGMPIEDYVTELEAALPDVSIRLARTPADERDLIADATIVTAPTIESSLLDRAESLRLFACMYSGTGHLPLEELGARDIAVTSAAGVHAPNVAEHVIGSILYFSRRFHIGARRSHRREWRHYQAGELAGSTVAVVGLGAIGTAVCERLRPFDVTILGHRYTPEKGGPADTVAGLGTDALHQSFAASDSVVLACPLTDETRGLIDRSALETMPPSAVVVNVARGPVIETDALVGALRRNRIAGAALDVTDPEPLPADHPLWRLEPVLLTPHNAGHTPRYYGRLADLVADAVGRIRADGWDTPLANQILPASD